MSGGAACEREFTVRHELGLHARPAGRFVTLAARFEAEIEVARGDEWVSGRSVLSLLSLAAGPGTRLRVRAVGEDAESAVATLGRLIEAAETDDEAGGAG
ncbi:MAG: HPr family phosphocarrier protein [Myxococcota bacterium]|nr:HPr family phosphocarrier protein [Myxococcota bacterium]